jgi:anaerobic ribonucleoside-triphosphate reductase activating protein
MMKTTLETPLKVPPGYLNIMGYVDESEVNGPDRRAVVWVQGCVRECPGCFNTASWFEENQLISVEELANKILSNPNNQGVTFSGGEPFWQAENLAKLAQLLKVKGLNTMSFTGFTLEELKSDKAPPHSQELLAELDLLIDGPYLEQLAINDPNSLVSSKNQRVHILKDGSRIITGFRGAMGLDNS